MFHDADTVEGTKLTFDHRAEFRLRIAIDRVQEVCVTQEVTGDLRGNQRRELAVERIRLIGFEGRDGIQQILGIEIGGSRRSRVEGAEVRNALAKADRNTVSGNVSSGHDLITGEVISLEGRFLAEGSSRFLQNVHQRGLAENIADLDRLTILGERDRDAIQADFTERIDRSSFGQRLHVGTGGNRVKLEKFDGGGANVLGQVNLLCEVVELEGFFDAINQLLAQKSLIVASQSGGVGAGHKCHNFLFSYENAKLVGIAGVPAKELLLLRIAHLVKALTLGGGLATGSRQRCFLAKVCVLFL